MISLYVVQQGLTYNNFYISKMKFKVDRKVMDYLSEFDLTEREIIVYLTLLRTGPNTIMNLARETGIKRSTTHNNVEELVNKGLVSQTNYGERRMVVAEEPDKLKFLIENRKWTINKLEKNMPDILKSIYELVPNANDNTSVKVKYYTGENGFKEATQRSITQAKGEILQLSNMSEWRKVFTYEYAKDSYIPARLKAGVFARTLAVKDDIAEKNKKEDAEYNREMRFFPDTVDFKSTILIYGGEVLITKSIEPYVAILIEDNTVAETFRQIFNLLWDSPLVKK